MTESLITTPKGTMRQGLLTVLLIVTGGYGGTQLHEADMQHMRERIGDIRNDDRNRYEDLMRTCIPVSGARP